MPCKNKPRLKGMAKQNKKRSFSFAFLSRFNHVYKLLLFNNNNKKFTIDTLGFCVQWISSVASFFGKNNMMLNKEYGVGRVINGRWLW